MPELSFIISNDADFTIYEGVEVYFVKGIENIIRSLYLKLLGKYGHEEVKLSKCG